MMDKVIQRTVVERRVSPAGRGLLEAGDLNPRKMKGSVETETSEFGGELLQAQALIQSAPVTGRLPALEATNTGSPDFRISLGEVKPEAKVELNGKTPEAGVTLEGAGAMEMIRGLANKGVAQDARNARNAMTGNAEKSPLSMKAAAGLNTAAAIAGLKPWSREWIFDAEALKDPNLKPLFDSQPKAEAKKAETPEAAQLIAQLRAGGEASDVGALSNDLSLPKDLELSGELQAQAKPRADSSESMGGSEFVNTLNLIRGGDSAVQGLNGGASGAGPQGDSGRRKDSEGGNAFKSLSGAGTEAGSVSGSKAGRTRKSAFEAATAGLAQGEPANLRLLAGGLGSPGNTMRGPASGTAPVEVTGHVIQGAMAKDRLSSESLGGVSAGIRTLSLNGGGEMKVRLRPDNLGELNIHVTARGNQVGLKIQASDEQAKKILEESISHLKESMAGQRLELSRVDFTVAQAGANGLLNDGAQDQSQRNNQQSWQQSWNGMDQGSAFNGFSDLTGQGRGQGNDQSGLGRQSYDRLSSDESGRSARAPVPGLGGIGRGELAGRTASGRLDVRA